MPDPQLAPDPIADVLRAAPTTDQVRASAWDTFHGATDEDDLANKLRLFPLPPETKAQLWDHKAGVARPQMNFARVNGQDVPLDPAPDPTMAAQLDPQHLGAVPDRPPQPTPPLAGVPFDPIMDTVRGLVRGATIGTTDPNDNWAAKGATLGMAALPLVTGARSLLSGAEGAGLFSRLDQAMESLPAQAHASKVLSVAKNATSADEIAWRGLPEWLSGFGNTPVSRDAVQAFLADRPIDPQVTLLGEPGRPATKYASYQVPGGSTYREHLITLPPPSMPFEDWVRATQGREPGSFNRAAVDRLKTQYAANPGDPNAETFQSSHFDQPNILAHTRSNERTLPTGEPGRFLEEVQSDWHQTGKEKGYTLSEPERAKQLASLEREYVAAKDGPNPDPDVISRLMDKWNAFHDTAYGVPNAPFKDQWQDLALKQHLLDVAQRPDLQWLGFTSGETQAARYDLSKQVDGISWTPWPAGGADHGILSAYKDGNQVIKQQITRDKVADYIGKDAAAKLLAAPSHPRFGNAQELTGLDLTVGGKGMREFYDHVLPSRLQKIVKPFGGTVERIPVTPSRSVAQIDADMDANMAALPETDDPGEGWRLRPDLSARHDALQQERNTASWPKPSGWMVRLPPEMKAKILKAGLPLMTVGAALAPQKDPQP